MTCTLSQHGIEQIGWAVVRLAVGVYPVRVSSGVAGFHNPSSSGFPQQFLSATELILYLFWLALHYVSILSDASQYKL
jgi:hypothetical protein